MKVMVQEGCNYCRGITDNRNRTASEVRSSFTKYNGNLGESGSVSYLFKNLGLIIYEKNEKLTLKKF